MPSAFLLLNCHFPFDKNIMSAISGLPFVLKAHRVEGRYDLIVKIDADTDSKMADMVSHDIKKIQGIDEVQLLKITSQFTGF